MTAWPSYLVDVFPGNPRIESGNVHLWKDAEERKNARRHRDFGHVRTRILCLLAQNFGYCSVDIIAEPQAICKSFLEIFHGGPAHHLRYWRWVYASSSSSAILSCASAAHSRRAVKNREHLPLYVFNYVSCMLSYGTSTSGRSTGRPPGKRTRYPPSRQRSGRT